jgi:lysozyme
LTLHCSIAWSDLKLGWVGILKSKRLLLWLGVALVLAAVLVWIATHWRPGLSRYPVQGIDVSHDNGQIFWPTVAADGVNFAYIKATEGADMHDPAFAANWDGAAKAGLRRGAVHFFTLCRPASDQATNFMAYVPRDNNALPAALTLQFAGNCSARPGRSILLREIATFIRMAEEHSGKPMILHIEDEFEAEYRVSEAINRSLWLNASLFPPTYGAKSWAMWQSSTIMRVRGISGGVNWNVVRK